MPKLYIEIDRHGVLFYVLDAFLGAYNRRTDRWAADNKEAADMDELKKRIDSADAELTKEKK